jgi:hypothetical protein
MVISGTVATKLNHTSLLVLLGAQQAGAAGLPVEVAFTLVAWVQPNCIDSGVALHIKSLAGACAETVVVTDSKKAKKNTGKAALSFFISFRVENE